MEEQYGYLKFLINEEIYALHEGETAAPAQSSVLAKIVESDPLQAAVPAPAPTINMPKPEAKAQELPTKNILIIYQYPSAEKLPAHLKTLMLKILEAIKVDVKGADFVNDAYKPLPSPITHYKNVLIFGKAPQQHLQGALTATPYQVQSHGTTRIMIADPLDALDQDKALKLQLWGMLKTMFDV